MYFSLAKHISLFYVTCYEDIKIYFYHYIIINKKKLLEIIQKEKSNIDFNENISQRTLF